MKKSIEMTPEPKKNSVKFVASGDDQPFDNIYVKNSLFAGNIPDKVTVTVEWNEGGKSKKGKKEDEDE